jgi:hypothetical protein
MIPIKTIGFGLCLILAGPAFANEKPRGTIKANAVVCATQSGIAAARAEMNEKQLQSLRCTIAPTDVLAHVLPPSGACDPYLFVAAAFPDKIVRYWISRADLDAHALRVISVDVDCPH